MNTTKEKNINNLPSNSLPKKDVNKVFAGSFYTFFVNGIIALILGAILPYMRGTYDLSYKVAGILIAFHSIGNLIASFVAGVLPLRIGRRKSVLFLSSFAVIGFFLMIITDNPFLLIFAFAATGLTKGGVSNFNNGIMNEIATGKGWALNILHGFFAVGAFVSPFLAMLFTRNNPDGWIHVILVVAIMCLTSFCIFVFIPIPNDKLIKSNNKSKKDNGNNEAKVKVKTDWSFLKNKYFITATGILFFYMGAEQGINGWLVTYFKDSGLMSGPLAQIMSSVLWLIILFGRILYAWLSTYVEKSKLLIGGAIGYLIFFIMLLSGREIRPIFIGIIGVGFFMSGIFPTTLASIGIFIIDYPMALSFMLTIAGLGAIIMPIVIGAVADTVGIIGGMSMVIVAVAITFILLVYYRFILRDIDRI